MKNFSTFGFVALLTATTLFSSCDKESLQDVASPVAEEANSLDSQGLVVNAIANSALTDLGISLNGVSLASGLDYKEISEYAGIDAGEAIIDLVAHDGVILASTSYTFEGDEVYNIVILMNEDGVTPEIRVLEIDPTDFEINDSFGSELGLEIDEASMYAVNAVDYTVGVQGENVYFGLDYMGAGSTAITGLLDTEYGAVSGVFFGSDEVLENIDILTSSLDMEALMAELNSHSGGVLDPLELGDAYGIGEVLTGGEAAGLLGSLSELMSGILGENQIPMEMLSADLLDGVDFLPGHNYTIVLTGAGQTIDFVVIDQTIAGLQE